MRALIAGNVSARVAYRWLRRCPRIFGDVHLRIWWRDADRPPDYPMTPGADDDLPDATWEALHRFDLGCKTLDDAWPGRWELRTRGWRGRAQPRRRRDMTPGARWNLESADRADGLRIARRLAALLRAAHRDGIALRVEAA